MTFSGKWPVDHQLASFRFLAPPEFRPTPVRVLIIDRDPEEHLLGSYVQFVRFDGGQLSEDLTAYSALSGCPQPSQQLVAESIPGERAILSLSQRATLVPRVTSRQMVYEGPSHDLY
jgi:hypothetical protein